MGQFSDDFFENMPKNPKSGTLYIADSFDRYVDSFSHIDLASDDTYGDFLDFYALLSKYVEIHDLDVGIFELDPNRRSNISRFTQLLNDIRNDYQPIVDLESAEERREHFSAKLRGSFAYEFTNGDINRVQELINELRGIISNDDRFEDGHRARLLKRLEKLQSELHKRMSDLDTFWGLVGDAGVVIGKFGNDIEPFVRRIREMKDIFWNAQSRAEELPSNSTFPLLNDESDEDEA